ncbi:ras and EF-hand domain-containing protein homolog [Planococcus citri]|uniref:ras and EF-hand domain-containing protein homolog n=1 Tax=Planococcus citri TaxID=170843 RepID=UPI0031F9F7F3
MAEEQLVEWFRACDKKGTGKIGRSEFKNFVANYGISPSEADAIFNDLDNDKDDEMNMNDFLREFRKTLDRSENAQKNCYTGKMHMMIERRKSDAKLAMSHLVDGIGEGVARKFLNNSGKEIEELYHELQNVDSSPELVTQFEKTLSSLFQDVKNLYDENQKLEQMFIKEKEFRAKTMKGLEEEFDSQIAKVEANAREQAYLRYEQEKKEIQERLESEKAELEMKLKVIEKTNLRLSQQKTDSSHLGLKYETNIENEKLKDLLSDTRTNFAYVNSEMARIKSEYETKCRELNNHHEAVMQYMEQNKFVRRQLALLQKANENLQDTNDSLLTIMETASGRITPYCVSRAGSDSGNSDNKGHVCNRMTLKPMHNHLLNEQNYENGSQYVIQRLMEDIDSGHSTLRDPIECDIDNKWVHEEFSDAESLFKSLESDDSKNSRQRTNKSDYGRMTPVSVMSFEATGNPDRTYKVVLAGDAAVGKSCFIHRFCRGNFSNRIGSTLGVDFQIKTIRVDEKNIALQLWDTAGQERFRSMTKTYFRRADGVVLLYDVTSERSFLNIRQWIQSINECADKEIPILICGNKIDLRDEAMSLGASCVQTKHGEALAKDHNALFFETSSKSGKNIFDAIIAISREMLLKEDVEVQTSALQVSQIHRSASCCGR